jgi:hypothetical protein
MLVDFWEEPKGGGLEENGCRRIKSCRSEGMDRRIVDYVPQVYSNDRMKKMRPEGSEDDPR